MQRKESKTRLKTKQHNAIPAGIYLEQFYHFYLAPTPFGPERNHPQN
jgi:hypothetical protein